MEISSREAYDRLMAMPQDELIATLDEFGLPYDIVNGALIDRERIIENLTGIRVESNVNITYTWNGERKEEIRTETSAGCRTCGS